MNCQEYEYLWNIRLDAGSASDPALDRALDEHAETCAACRLTAQRYRALREALAVLGTPGPPSPGFADRVLAARDGLETASRRRWTVQWAAGAAAAAVLAAVVLTVRVGSRNDGLTDQPPSPPVVVESRPPLAEVLSEATSATLELARATTDPAGRVGRRMFDAATVPDAVPDLPTTLAANPEVLQAVGGGRVGSGVRPLSGTARQAFGFLLVEAQ